MIYLNHHNGAEEQEKRWKCTMIITAIAIYLIIVFIPGYVVAWFEKPVPVKLKIIIKTVVPECI